MKIGKAEPVIELEPPKKKRPTLSGGSGSSGRDNGGGGMVAAPAPTTVTFKAKTPRLSPAVLTRRDSLPGFS
jgi:hypothetical protein